MIYCNENRLKFVEYQYDTENTELIYYCYNISIIHTILIILLFEQSMFPQCYIDNSIANYMVITVLKSWIR